MRLISTVDSADYAKYDITPEQVINYLFKLDTDSDIRKNKFAMGLVLNKLLLAFKNKPGFLENLVMSSEPSLYSILNQIKNDLKKYAVHRLFDKFIEFNQYSKDRELKKMD